MPSSGHPQHFANGSARLRDVVQRRKFAYEIERLVVEGQPKCIAVPELVRGQPFLMANRAQLGRRFDSDHLHRRDLALDERQRAAGAGTYVEYRVEAIVPDRGEHDLQPESMLGGFDVRIVIGNRRRCVVGALQQLGSCVCHLHPRQFAGIGDDVLDFTDGLADPVDETRNPGFDGCARFPTQIMGNASGVGHKNALVAGSPVSACHVHILAA